MTHATRALQSHDLSGEKLTLDHIQTFLTTQGHGGPPQISDQLNAGATSEKTQTWKTIHTIHAPIHSNKANIKGWYDGQMTIGNLVGLKVPDLQLRKNPEKPTQETWDRTQARCVTGAYATTCSTAVDWAVYHEFNFNKGIRRSYSNVEDTYSPHTHETENRNLSWATITYTQHTIEHIL